MGFVLIGHCRGTSQGKLGLCTEGPVCVGEIVGKIGEVSVRENLCMWSVSGAARNET